MYKCIDTTPSNTTHFLKFCFLKNWRTNCSQTCVCHACCSTFSPSLGESPSLPVLPPLLRGGSFPVFLPLGFYCLTTITHFIPRGKDLREAATHHTVSLQRVERVSRGNVIPSVSPLQSFRALRQQHQCLTIV